MTTSRTPPQWRGAFLRGLARSGSVASAAEACGIDRTSAYQLKRRNAAFAASWERALAVAREGLSEAEVRAPAEAGASGRERTARPNETPACPKGSLSRAAGLSASRRAGEQGGETRPKRPTLRPNETIRASKTGRVCIARVGPGRWSAAKEAVFLAELTASANVKAAARAAGVSAQAAYNRRKLWPAFAEAWRAAVAEGFARIETLLVCAATTTLDPEPLPERAWEAPQMSIDQAIKIWLTHRAGGPGAHKQRLGGVARREPDIEEVRAEIMRKVAAIKRARSVR